MSIDPKSLSNKTESDFQIINQGNEIVAKT